LLHTLAILLINSSGFGAFSAQFWVPDDKFDIGRTILLVNKLILPGKIGIDAWDRLTCSSPGLLLSLMWILRLYYIIFLPPG